MNSNTRKNAALLRYEAQRQASYKRRQLVVGLVLGIAIVGLLWYATPNPPAMQAATPAVATHDAQNPLVLYARDGKARIDQQIDEQTSSH